MKKTNGFTLIELVVVIVILGILAAVAIPKFVNLSDDAELASMQGMQATLRSARDLTFLEVKVKPQNLNTNGRRFTLDSGEQIRLRADYPDGRWSNTFVHLVDISSVTFTNSNQCDVDTDWCVRHKGSGWFTNRNGYSSVTGGRGFVIYPNGYNLNQQACYIYYYTPNTNNSLVPLIPIVGIDDTDC